MKASNKGFTLTELLVIIALTGILAVIAIPSFTGWIVKMRYRESARNIASTLRDARSRAIGKNIEHRVEFDVVNDKYRMTAGNRAYNSSSFSDVIMDYVQLPSEAKLKSGPSCDQDTNINIQFNPDGSSGSGGTTSVCVLDVNNVQKFKIRMASTTTGRIVIE